MNPNYTPEQLQAVTEDGCDLLVAAAAGSGKTAVLVGRIIRLISEPPYAADIDKLLVVTFTDAAASEMRARISDALTQKLSVSVNDDNLRKQLNLLNKASITTIHSFCLHIIRKHFHSLDIDPIFRIADDAEKKLLKAQVLAELFEEEYGREDNEPFFELVESYGGSRTNDGRLEDLILDTYEFISSYPWPEQWLTDAVVQFDIPGDCSLSDTVWAGIITEDLRLSLSGAMESAIMAKKICMQAQGPDKYLPVIEADICILNELLIMDIDELYDALNNINFMRLPPYTSKNRGDTSETLINTFKYIREKHIKEAVKKCVSVFIKEPSALISDIRALHAPLNTLKRLTLEFQARYSAEKKERNILDFNDLEHFCLKILIDESSTPNNPKPSLIARLIGEDYYEVLTDEYQDTNLTQELILSSLGRKRFMVGDVKQSIYKFRRAEPELFMKKYRSFASKSEAPGNQIKIDLSVNFRSRSCVIDAVNFLFCQLMQERTGGISYDDKAALYYGADFPKPLCDNIKVSDSAEFVIIKKEEGGNDYETYQDDSDASESAAQELSELIDIELEAKYISQRIKELTGPEGLSVLDAKTKEYRPAQYKDIVILLRSTRNQADVISNVLAAHGIPAYAKAAAGYFESTEIQTMLAILQIVDNPRQDIHLLAVLRSPALYALTSDMLLEIHCHDPAKCFYDCVKEYITSGQSETLKSSLAQFMRDLNKWRDQAVYMPISALIDNIYESTGLVGYAKAMAGGAAREGNLRLLQERAASYENTSYKGLFHFIRYIDRIQRFQGARIDMEDAQTASENDNLVRIMTIHKSKGLEYPIVFISGLGRRFNIADERKTVIMHQELGFGPYYIDLNNRIRSRSLPHIALGMRLHAENLAEELRVLYVAATRAREKLIFTGCVKNYESKRAKWSIAAQTESEYLPPHYVLSASNFLDWLAPAICRSTDCRVLAADEFGIANNPYTGHPARFEVKIINKYEIMNDDTAEAVANAEEPEMQQIAAKDAVQATNISAWEYPRKKESGLPVKVSISEIKRRYQTEILTEKVIHIPASLRLRGRPHGAEIGTAMHTVMEHLNIKEHRGEAEITELISRLIDSNIIEREAALAIDVNKIYRFVNGRLAGRMRESLDIRTETRFVLALAPYEVYGQDFSANNDTKIMLHGIIDCFFKENDGWILVDYKSDHISYPSQIQEIKDRYALQLNFYARAIESRTGMPVKEMLLYLFDLSEEITIYREDNTRNAKKIYSGI